MRCTKAKILISASLDGELSRRNQLALDQHLGSCAECAQEMTEFSGLRDVMSCWPDEEPSEWLAANFSQKLEQFQHERLAMKPGRPRWVLGFAATGMAAVLVMVGFMLHMTLNKPQPLVAQNPAAIVKPPPKHTNAVNKQVNQDKVANNPVTTNPPVVKPMVYRAPNIIVNRQKTAPKPVQVASSNIGDTGYSVRSSGWREARNYNIASRRYKPNVQVDPDQVDEMRVAMAVASEGAPVSRVADNLNEAGVIMNESVERVRGTLQRAVDLAVAGTPVTEKHELDYNGGSTL